ncbi:hypothetical protein Bca4012_032422 [Brassica carinata]
MVREFKCDIFILISLPENIIVLIYRLLYPSDICNLSFCCKSLCDIVSSENVWLDQCEIVKALCRFLVEVMKPLVRVWVYQEPKLGNVVYLMHGFLSVVGCRLIPQEVGPLAILYIDYDPFQLPMWDTLCLIIMWSPVFEIICYLDGSTKFFLQGRDRKDSCLYPGLVTGIEKSCNVLSLEVEQRQEKTSSEASTNELFSKLSCTDKKYLVELVTNHVGLLHVSEPLSVKLFPTRREDEGMLLERRTMLLKMHKFGVNWKHLNLKEEDGLCYNPKQVDINEMWEKNHDAYFEFAATNKERDFN